MKVCTSHGPATISVTSITNRRGRKLRVCSLIWVAAWNMATNSPTSKLGITNTATINVVSHSASRKMSTATSGVMATHHQSCWPGCR
ncbi:hypothetical protein D3C87_1947480 [compost metagenome]